MTTAAMVHPGEELVKAKTEHWLNPNKGKANNTKGKASVIPAKRRLVKSMMLDFLLRLAASLCSSATKSNKQKMQATQKV
ncbi:hypothetical protein OWV82_024123 [Melia azedarach]|uniref:Uncharacterized protein n=1 Tax=Melia azedarach TaxID=155640 RepID=A0ACC1WS99_MELAZ|nr:hypothetical protein OWV82_024123 [Melia azedarach]